MPRLDVLRAKYQKAICGELLAHRKDSDIPNIADRGSAVSIDFSRRVASLLGFPLARRPLSPQTIGQRFAELTKDFVSQAFSALGHLRPGTWTISTAQSAIGIAAFDQYEHLAQLQKLLLEHPRLKTALGGDYLITPDIIIAREPERDEAINANARLVGEKGPVASFAPLRERNGQKAILHASISCKWTMRSDRSQNTRTEALNLIRNRKGNTPHIAVVTFEPLPGRLASIALGTGDVDCTYHVALHELRQAVAATNKDGQRESLEELIEGRRLRDISDLPLDLAV